MDNIGNMKYENCEKFLRYEISIKMTPEFWISQCSGPTGMENTRTSKFPSLCLTPACKSNSSKNRDNGTNSDADDSNRTTSDKEKSPSYFEQVFLPLSTRIHPKNSSLPSEFYDTSRFGFSRTDSPLVYQYEETDPQLRGFGLPGSQTNKVRGVSNHSLVLHEMLRTLQYSCYCHGSRWSLVSPQSEG